MIFLENSSQLAGYSINAENKRRASRSYLLGAVASLSVLATFVGPMSAAKAEVLSPVTVAGPVTPPSFADVVERVKPAVVAIKVKGVEVDEGSGGLSEMSPDLSPDDPMYRFFKRFGRQGGGTENRHATMSQGSGFIISPDGYVVTNNHVVEHASEVEVSLDNGKTLAAKIIGTDKRTDLALLKINDREKFPFVDWSTGNPRIGDWVIAVGNPFGLGGSVTAGIVSARGREIGAGPYDDFLQIDAPVNRGNSGGPAFDARGNVIGVNTAIYSPSGGSIGIGFAIPSEVARDVVASLKDKGVVARGWIGVKIQNITPEIADSLGLKSTKGALISQPQHGAPAEQAGLKSGDIVIALNGEKIDGPRDLARRVAILGPKTSVDLTYLRAGSDKTVRLTLGLLPEETEARADVQTGKGGAEVAGLGVEVAPAIEAGAGREGVVVTDIDPNSAAAQKGLRQGDIIVEAGGQVVNSRVDLSSAIESAREAGHKSVLFRVKSVDGMRFIALPTKAA